MININKYLWPHYFLSLIKQCPLIKWIKISHLLKNSVEQTKNGNSATNSVGADQKLNPKNKRKKRKNTYYQSDQRQKNASNNWLKKESKQNNNPNQLMISEKSCQNYARKWHKKKLKKKRHKRRSRRKLKNS